MSNLPPSGEIPRGAIRFNTDSNKPELWDGSQWAEFQLSTPNLGRSVDTQPGARGLVFGGQTPSNITGIDAFNISSTGSAFEFGDLSAHSRYQGSTSSSTLAVTAGGANALTNIDRTVFSSQGTSVSHGSLSSGRYGLGAVSNGTRAVFIGGFIAPSPNGPQDTMDYITISSGGTAQSFGTLTDSKNYMGACASPVRGVFAGGTPVASPFTPLTSDIEFIATATLGSEQDFGNLTGQYSGMSGLSNPTRGVFAGGYTSPPFAVTNVIDYITISTKGNASSFGDLTVSGGGQSSNGGASSPTRGVFVAMTNSNNMEMVNILTEGNSVDFGDLFEGRSNASAASNTHGGL